MTPGGPHIYGIRVLSFIAFYGLAYQKKIVRVLFWRAFFVLHSFLLYKIIKSLLSTSVIEDVNLPFFLGVASVILFIYVPFYYANFRYAFRSENIWMNEKQKGEKGTSVTY